MEEKRFYWLKLKRDFFKRHDIKIIESMQNGKDYLLFYLKLLVESVDHEGNLRFSEEIPYNEEMLSVITNTNVDIVRSAIKIFTQLNMMEILDDGTYYMNEVNKMIGSAVDNDNANRQRRFREKQKQLALQESYDSVTNNNESKSIDIDIDKKESIINNTKEKEEGYIPETAIPQEKVDKLIEGSNIQKIFNTWNDSNIIKHRELTDSIRNQIKKSLKTYSLEQILLAINHYKEAFHSDYEYCDYKWNLETFLKQGNCLKDFLDDGTKWNNYLDWKNKKSNPYSSSKPISKSTSYPDQKDKNYW